MKRYKIKVFKYGDASFDYIIIRAFGFDSLCLQAEDFCRKSTTYKEWIFVGEDDEI
jgi:hypothetical protein